MRALWLYSIFHYYTFLCLSSGSSSKYYYVSNKMELFTTTPTDELVCLRVIKEVVYPFCSLLICAECKKKVNSFGSTECGAFFLQFHHASYVSLGLGGDDTIVVLYKLFPSEFN